MSLTGVAILWENERVLMRIFPAIAALMMTPLLHAVEWSIEQCSSLDLLAGRTGIADVRPTNDPHVNSSQMMEQNSGIYRGQWSWQSEMPELLYEIMRTGEATKVSPSGFTALHAACVYADENLFKALMETGLPVDARAGDWQQLGYVGDTPLGLLVRFMNARTAGARVRMARVLLERGANPDAPMTTWKGNRVVTTVPFCELGKQDFNHDMRLLLMQSGSQELAKRTAGWQLSWDWYRSDLVQHLRKNGLAKSTAKPVVDKEKVREVGKIPLLDLIRKGDVEGVRLALEAGANIEVSARAKRYGQEPLFNIPVRSKDSAEAAVEIARMLIDAGSDINALNRRGRSLRIHYDRYYTKASKALCAYLKERGSLIHPDSPMKKAEVAAEEQARQERIAARYRRLNGIDEEETATGQLQETPAQPEPQPVQPQETPAKPEPQPEQPKETPAQPEPQPEQPKETPAQPEPQPEQPQETPAQPEPQPKQPQETPAQPEPQPEQPQETPAQPEQQQEEAQKGPQVDPARMQALLAEVQNQLAELQAKYEAEQKAKDAAEQGGETETTAN